MELRPAVSAFEFDVPIEPVDPAFVKIVWWKGAAIVLQLPARRPPWLAVDGHMRLLRRAPTLLEVARRARGGDIFPACPSAEPPRHDMIEGKILARPAILARETVTQKEVEAGEGGILGRLHILAQRNHAGNRHRPGRRMNFARVILDDRDAVEEYRLDRGLPRPQAQRVIAQRRIVRVEHECGTAIGVAGEIG